MTRLSPLFLLSLIFAAWLAAADEPQVLIEVRVFDHWPQHEKLTFDLGQRHVDAPPRPDAGPEAHRMSEDEFAAFMKRVAQMEGDPVIAAPRVLTQSGQAATLRIGGDDAFGAPIDGMRIAVTPTVLDARRIHLRFTYEAFGLDVREPAASFDDGDRIAARRRTFTLAPGESQFLLATGYIGAPRHLVAVTASIISPEPAAAAPAQRLTPRSVRAVDADFFRARRTRTAPEIEVAYAVWELDDEPDLSAIIPQDRRVKKTVWMGEESKERPFEAVYFVPDARMKPARDWLAAHGRKIVENGASGVRTLAGDESLTLVSDAEPDDLGFTLTMWARQAGDEDRTVLIRYRHGSVDASLPAGVDARPYVSRLPISRGDWAVFAIPRTDHTPWRVLLVRPTLEHEQR